MLTRPNSTIIANLHNEYLCIYTSNLILTSPTADTRAKQIATRSLHLSCEHIARLIAELCAQLPEFPELYAIPDNDLTAA